MSQVEIVECRYCGERMQVSPTRRPVRYIERTDDGQRLCLIIDAADWLVHRCLIADG